MEAQFVFGVFFFLVKKIKSTNNFSKCLVLNIAVFKIV